MAQTIVIDPGHPSEVGMGASGKLVTEVFVAWDVALRLEKLLKTRGYKVVLTKKAEREYVTNVNRALIANAAEADLMLRLHCDAASERGFATYYPDRAGLAHGKSGPSADVIARSKAAARMFHPAVIRAMGGALRDRGIRTDRDTSVGAKQGALTGSIYSVVPVLLLEMVVLTDRSDEALVNTGPKRQKLASALADGIDVVFRTR